MKKKYIYSILTVIALAIISIAFFYPDDIEGNVLQQHDTMQGIANGQEGKAYHEATGNTTRWTNSLFGGMPNFQITPSYPANTLLSWVGKVYMLGLPSPANLLFGMMLGFFIMCLCFKMRWQESLFGALAWGFSTYFIIIIGAGHIWKFVTLAYIPPTIGGIALCYRKKYLPGTALAALFGALQLQSNHPQMSYYFILVILAMMIAWLCASIRKKEVKSWFAATGCVFAAALIAVAANSPSLYNSYEYSKQTVRGKATELTATEGGKTTGGMDRSAITAWSYGIDETFTLLIPNVKGGATIKPHEGNTALKSVLDTDKAEEMTLSPEERQFIYQFSQYFGDQPMTNGPVYVGAFVLLLAILALLSVDSPMKWALFAVSILAILLSWGHNFQWFTDLFIDYFPMYSKFRAVSSILVIVEFTVPLLAVLCIKNMVDNPQKYTSNPWLFYTVFGLGALICLVGWLSPGVFGQPFSQQELHDLQQAGAFANPVYSNVINAISESRLSLVSSDCFRSLIFILLGGAVIWIYLFTKNKQTHSNLFILSLTVLMLIDLFSVNRRYVNHENFTTPVDNETAFEMTDADRAILQDKGNYRVLDIDGMGSARSSYFHKTIGGYHAAKLTRYNDLLTHQIKNNNIGVLNMLNTKYILYRDQSTGTYGYEQNPEALGNAWLINDIAYVSTADEEMAALDSLDTGTKAVADRKFEKVLGKARSKEVGDTIYETSYAPDRLTYQAKTQKGGIAVFSEIYFPWGWQATIDGKPAEIGRVNYVLRALSLQPGEHSIEFKFDPKSTQVTNNLSITAVVIIYILCGAAIVIFALRTVSKKRKENQ